MPTDRVRQALQALRTWTARSADQLAATASLLVEQLGLHPAPETTAAARLTARTVRYYTAEGVLSPPEGSTRRPVYGYRHLLELLWIKEAQGRGQSLEQIRGELAAYRRDGAPSTDGDAALEATLLQRLPERAPYPLPSSPEELVKAVSAHFQQRMKRRWRSGGLPKLLAREASPPPYYGSAPEAPVGEAFQSPGGPPWQLRPWPRLESSAAAAAAPASIGGAKEWAGGDLGGASLHVQVDLGEGLRLLVPAEHPLAGVLLDRRLTVDDLRQLLSGLGAQPRPGVGQYSEMPRRSHDDGPHATGV